MKELSPKKYVETKARNLPIYKCFINRDWQSSKMANVIVMRRHVNGNVTVGIYLIDLLCLGVKDAHFLFNEPEDKVLDLFKNSLQEVDYNLAHNIVYAGHDFAMEYDIQPHPDFKTVRYILEEDDDNIPLIEVEVGDSKGLPSLILQPGQEFKYRNVYEKLTSKLGKDNFNYYVGDGFDEFEEDDDDEDEKISNKIDDYELGSITPCNVTVIDIEDLINEEKRENRTSFEISTIMIELSLRLILSVQPAMFDEIPVDEREEYFDIESAPFYPESFSQELEEQIIRFEENDIEFLEQITKNKPMSDEERSKHNIKMLHKYANNPVVVSKVLEDSIYLSLEIVPEVRGVLKRLSLQYPIAKINYAFSTLILDEKDSLIDYVVKGDDINSVFPNVESFSLYELYSFWLLKTFYELQNNNLKKAIYYYELLAETDLTSVLLDQVQRLMSDKINEFFDQMDKEN